MYEQFCETEDPHVEVMKTQHTPKLERFQQRNYC